MSADGPTGALHGAAAAPARPGESTRVELGLAPRRRLASDALFRGDRELVIVHAGKEYVLRITRLGKLILTA